MTLSPTNLENLENFRVEKIILVRVYDGDFLSFTLRTRVSLIRDRDYSNKHTADVSCERDGSKKREREGRGINREINR